MSKEKLIEDIHAKVLGRIASVKGREEARKDIKTLVNKYWQDKIISSMTGIREWYKKKWGHLEDGDIAEGYDICNIIYSWEKRRKPQITGEQLMRLYDKHSTSNAHIRANIRDFDAMADELNKEQS